MSGVLLGKQPLGKIVDIKPKTSGTRNPSISIQTSRSKGHPPWMDDLLHNFETMVEPIACQKLFCDFRISIFNQKPGFPTFVATSGCPNHPSVLGGSAQGPSGNHRPPGLPRAKSSVPNLAEARRGKRRCKDSMGDLGSIRQVTEFLGATRGQKFPVQWSSPGFCRRWRTAHQLGRTSKQER